MADNTVKFGGVKLNKTEVAKMQERKVQDSYGRNEAVYVIDFKNGTQVAYRGATKNSVIEPYITSNKADVTETIKTDVLGVMGLEIKGSSKFRDNIEITNGSIIGVDVSLDGGGDEVKVHGSQADNRMQYMQPKSTLAPTRGEIRVDNTDNTSIRQPGEKDYTREGKFDQIRRFEDK